MKLHPEIMSHLYPGLLSAYNSLTDKHLTGYFNNTRIRRHLQRVGLITRSGRIVPDKEYRHNVMQRAHQRHVRECLAQAIFHKVLDMERLHQIEIKRKLEDFARRERVHKIKVERSKRYEEEVIHILSPRPPTGPRVSHAQHSGPEGEHSESSESMDKDSRRHLTGTEFSHGISPYRLPVINNFVTPVPPPTKRKERGGFKGTPNGTFRGRRLRPTTAPSGPGMMEDSTLLRTSVQSKVCVSMVFFGKTVHLSHDLMDMRDEVKVFQQHCGGENLCVYKGRVQEGETFQFVSRRHRGFPFSLTFFLNGLQVERLSSCCEFKHRKGSRLGGRHGHFGFSSTEGASPCYRCIIALGLDKKPTPPPKRVKEEIIGTRPLDTGKDTAEVEEEMIGKDSHSQPEPETTQPQDMETEIKEDIPQEEDKPKDDYEEDFEADDEGQAEDKKSFRPSRERDGEDREKDDRSDSEDDDKDEERRSRSRSDSSSSGSDMDDSEAEAKEDQAVNQAADLEEAPPQAEQAKDNPTTIALDPDQPPTEDHTTATESSSPTPPQTTSTGEEDTGTLGYSPGDSTARPTELEVSDTSGLSEKEGKGDDDGSAEAKEEYKESRAKAEGESTQEEAPERAKSVQEKLAEAILKEAQSHSEPELSDTSTETEEDPNEKNQQQDTIGTEPEQAGAFTLECQISTEEVKCEESLLSAQEMTSQSAAEGKEVGTELKKEEEDGAPESEQITEETSGVTEEKEEDPKASPETDDQEETDSKVETKGKEEGEETKGNQEEDEAVDLQADEPAKARDSVTSKEQQEENTAADPDIPPSESEEMKSTKDDESSAPEEPASKTEIETAVTDEAGTEVAESETVEMKAEPIEDSESHSHKEMSITDKDRQGDEEEDTVGGTETEVTADNSNSVSEKSGDTTVCAEKRAGGAEKSEDAIGETEAKLESDTGEAMKEESLEKEAGQDEVGGETTTEDEVENDFAQIEEGKVKDGEKTGNVKKEEKEETEEVNTGAAKRDEERVSEGKVDRSEKDGEDNAEEGTQGGENTEGNKAEEEETDDSKKAAEVEDKVECEEKKAGQAEKEDSDGEEIVKEEGKLESGEMVEENKAANVSEHETGEKEGEEVVEENVVDAEEAGELKAEEGENMTTTEVKVEETEIKDNVHESACDVDENDESDKENGSSPIVGDSTAARDETRVSRKETEKKDSEVDSENGETAAASEVQSDTAREDTESTNQDTQGKNNTGEDKVDEKDMEAETKTDDPNKVETEEDPKDQEEANDKCENTKVDHDADKEDKESKAEKSNRDSHAGSHVGDPEPVNTGAESKEEAMSENADKETKNVKEIETSVESQEQSEQKTKSKDRIVDATLESEDKNPNTSTDSLDDGKENVNDATTEVIVVSEETQAQASEPRAMELEDTTETESDLKEKEHKTEDESTEGSSKPSEDGASIVLKPQSETPQKESSASGKEANVLEESVKAEDHAATPETLEKGDNRDLVTNWVNVHQSSKFFETFIEPLDDFTSDNVISESNSDARAIAPAHVTELSRPERPTKTAKTPDPKPDDHDTNASERSAAVGGGGDTIVESTVTELKEAAPSTKDENESNSNNKVEVIQSDLRSTHSRDDEASETGITKYSLEVKEETEVTLFTLSTELEHSSREDTAGPQEEGQSSSEELKGTTGMSEDDKDKDMTMQGETDLTEMSKTDVERIQGSNHSAASGRPENIIENPAETEETKDNSGLDEQQTLEEINVLTTSESPENHSESGTTSREPEDTKDTKEPKEQEAAEVTEITELRVISKSENESQEYSQSVQLHSKQLDGSRRGDKEDLQLIDQLSTCSVEDSSLFGHTSYPLLTTAPTDSNY
ncbi:glutamate-rich protein 3 isoform X2 [Salvelinus fontinalis]|uniref:glutamate-rich protein 3 isoform X2 n=1 Tax=Salvelinus fontinalis TaxID=8038 RepID=UPI0024858BC9|nr:glutamate-rich protein 3 isoform X2 [Salvelinus fontinalis]